MSSFKRPKNSANGPGGPCFAFRRGECQRGSDCPFKHVTEDSTIPPTKRKTSLRDASPSEPTKFHSMGVSSGSNTGGPKALTQEFCKRFQRGQCKFGNECRFLHEIMPTGSRDGSAPTGRSTPKAAAPQAAPVPAPSLPAPTTGSHITDHKFGDLPISMESRRAMAEVFKYTNLSAVQSQTLPGILRGVDCLAKAKTGTGKTLAFLIPTVENLVKTRLEAVAGLQGPGNAAAAAAAMNSILCLIISPTRELTAQIAKEAEILLTYHRGFKVVSIVGGTNIKTDIRRLNGRVDFLVATPGRLLDHLQQGLHSRFRNLRVMVMDEADQLLDMGFRPDIEKILALLPPPESRQTLLFSATVPPSVKDIAKKSLRTGYDYIDTVGEEVEQTHAHVSQSITVCEDSSQLATIAEILSNEVENSLDVTRGGTGHFKIIVFFTTARVTQYYSQLFNMMDNALLRGTQVFEMHSRKSQSSRTTTSNQFRDSRSAIMFSSDVSARGLDYPDVTYVLQVGLTDREQYIHRLGRTARAGKSGHGGLLLAPYEERHMRRQLKDMPLLSNTFLPSSITLTCVTRALGAVEGHIELKKSAEQAYGAWLGYYNSNLKNCGWDKPTLVQFANAMASFFGLRNQPRLLKKTVGKMGLKGVPGLLTE